jgi:hypothetical protein
MGAINPSKMPGGKKKARRDDTDFTQYGEGGEVESENVENKDVENKDVENKDVENSFKQILKYVPPKYIPYVEGEAGVNSYGSSFGGRAGVRASGKPKTFGKPDIDAYLEGGGYKPHGRKGEAAVTGAGATLNWRFAEGGETKSKVNEAGNYTKPALRKRIFNSVKAAAIVGTGAGEWSARKSQVLAKRYKDAGGGYRD